MNKETVPKNMGRCLDSLFRPSVSKRDGLTKNAELGGVPENVSTRVHGVDFDPIDQRTSIFFRCDKDLMAVTHERKNRQQNLSG